jgi:hypothetical protein
MKIIRRLNYCLKPRDTNFNGQETHGIAFLLIKGTEGWKKTSRKKLPLLIVFSLLDKLS